MALVRLETQHHPAGAFRPATSSCCCCCCCCCVGAAAGTLIGLPIMLLATRDAIEPAPAPATDDWPDASAEPVAQAATPRRSRARMSPGAVALGVMAAALPVVTLVALQLFDGIPIDGFGLFLSVTVLSIVVLTIWTAVRASAGSAVGGLYPVLLILLLFPAALIGEAAAGLRLLSDNNGTWYLALMGLVAAGMVLASWGVARLIRRAERNPQGSP